MKLMVEILDHAPCNWTTSERLVALTIAEQANDGTRVGYPGMELITHRLGLDEKSVSRLLRQLSRKGWELRVALSHRPDGVPVFAARGRRSVYRMPKLCPLESHSTTACVKRVAILPPFPDDPPAERVAVLPPFNEERVASGSRKGGHMATPSPQSPQKPSPQDVRQPTEPAKPKFDWKAIDRIEDERRARLGANYGPVQTIIDSLAVTDPDATEQEALAVFTLITRQAVEAGKPIKHGSYFTTIAGGGGFTMQLATARAKRLVNDQDAKDTAAAGIKDEIARLRNTEPDCEHGTAAGKAPHPATGDALCPYCRRGIPAPREATSKPADSSGRVVDAYRAGWETAGHEPIEMATLMAIAAEARTMLAAGHDPVLLTRIAAQAGAVRNTLASIIRRLSEALR